MRKAFCTFGVGPYEQVLDVSRPTFQKYCEIHKYDYIEQYPRIMGKLERPPSWGKIPLMLDLLEDYDFVVWSDCDAIVVRYDKDILDYVPTESAQAMVFEHHQFGKMPCCGFWVVRPEMIPWLEEAWKLEKYIHHYWWEQRAMHELMGYEGDLDLLPPVPRRVRNTELFELTWALGEEWNSYDFPNLNNPSNIIHFPVFEPNERAETMRRWLNGERVETVEQYIERKRRECENANSGEVRVHAF